MLQIKYLEVEGIMFSSRLVGIDIGSHSVKIAEVIPRGGELYLSAFGIRPIPANSIVLRDIIDRQAVIKVLKDAKERGKIRARNAVITLSGPGTYVKRVQLKGIKVQDIPHILSWEIQQWLPFPVDEAELDFEILKTDGNCVDLIFVAAKKSLIHSYVGVVKEAGFDPKVVDVDALALQNLYKTNYGNNIAEVTALLNVGESITTLHLFNKNGTLYVKDFLLGGEILTRSLQGKLNLGKEEAENLKVGSFSGGIPTEVKDEIENFIIYFAQHIGDAIRGWYEENPSTPSVVSVVTTGGSSSLSGFTATLSRILQINVEHLSSLRNIRLQKGLDSMMKHAMPTASLSIGLAARRGVA
jgi:type IV pilus assembly protein PilM